MSPSVYEPTHLPPVAIYSCKKSAGPPGLGIESSFISRNGFQWRAKSNSHLQGTGRKERERTQEVPGNANLWVNPPHLIVLLFVCDIDSSGGRLGATVPQLPTLHSAHVPFYRWTAANLPSPVFPGFQLGTRPEAMEGCNYTPRNNKTKQMRGELHQRAYAPGGG